MILAKPSSSYSVFIRCFPFSRDGRIYPIPSAILNKKEILRRLKEKNVGETCLEYQCASVRSGK